MTILRTTSRKILLLAVAGFAILVVTIVVSAGGSGKKAPITPAMLSRAGSLSEQKVGGYDYACQALPASSVREIRCDGQPDGSSPVFWLVSDSGKLTLASTFVQTS